MAATQQAVWTNGDFESNATLGVAPTGWTTQTFLNPALTDTRPASQTYGSLNLATGGALQTFVVGGATESQVDPDLGASASIRFPKYGIRGVRINYASNTAGTPKGANQNANVLTQTMTTTLGDVDPTDNKIHVRFAIAPVLQNPSHVYTQQPYYFVELVNTTTSQTLYQDFNTSGQAGVPWITTSSVLDASVVLYTNWQLVDVAPGNTAIRVGDALRLRVIAAGCSPGGHWGRVYLDAVGSGIPGLYTWMTGPQSANSSSNITYTVNYKNGGTTTASGTKLDLVIPTDTKFVSVSTPGSCTAPAVGGTGTVSCTLGTLAQGAVGSYTITVSINSTAVSPITNGNYSIYATGVSALIGPKVQTSVTAGITYADVAVSKTDGIAAIAWGQPLTYTMVVSNAGPAAANSVTLTDAMSAQLTGVTWTCAAVGGGTCVSSGSGSISSSLSLPLGASATYTVQANVIAGSGSSSLVNTATVAVTGVSDPDSTNNSAVDADSIGSLRTLTVTKTGANGGTISTSPALISCGPTCTSDSGSLLDGSSVILTAAPVPGSSFISWGGACSGSASTCNLTMTGDQAVTASFTPAPTLALASGSSQNTPVSTAFGSPLRALLTDSVGAAVAGATVYFAAPSSGASATLSATSAVTNSSGIASVTATANATGGTYSITATSPTAAGSVTFASSNYGTANSISVVSGSGQNSAVSTAFGSALTVVVRDATNVPVPSVTVSFTAPVSGASATLSAASAVTDSTGRASISATAGTVAGTYNVTASVSGVGTSASLALTNTAGAAASIAASSGGTQSATVLSGFATALTVTVRDAQSNPVPGASVSFGVPGSAASATLSSSSATTNASGQASVTATATATAGAYSVSATVGAVTPASFALTNLAGSATQVVASSGSGQSAVVAAAFGSALVASVLDSQGNPVSGVTVAFAVPGSGASGVGSTASGSSDAAGHVSITVTANTVAGSYNVTASVTGIALTAPFVLSNTVGAVNSIAAVSGGGQSRTIGVAFGSALVAVVRDAYNNPIAGVTVAFTVPSSGASAQLSAASGVSDAVGQVSVTAAAGLVSGSYNVSAKPAGSISPATFTLTNNAGAAAAIAVTSGGAQSTAVTSAFAAALRVTVSDAQGNPVPGATVSFAAPTGVTASAALSAATALTDSLGQASVTATANNLAGAYVVTASVAGASTNALFGSTNLPGAVATIAVTSGQAQHATVTHAFTAPLTATVSDAQGNPVPSVSVSFAAPSTGASAAVSSSSATSDASGVVSVTVIANSAAGGYSVTASAAGAASPASFTLSNDPDAPSSIVATSGGGQSATVTAAFGAVLSATVLDAYSNPVPGVMLTFTPPAGVVSATLSAPSVVTNSAGVATGNATASSAAGTYSVTASIATPGITALFALTNVAGAPGSIAAIGGDAQHAVVAAAYATALRVQVLDAFSNPVQGVLVSFSLPASSPSALLSGASAMTDSSGEASVTATADHVAGAFNVTASAPGAATPASFALTNDPGAASSIVASGGAMQSATVATAFAASLSATVLDTYGNTIPSVSVSFSAPSSGAAATLSSASATTNAVGVAVVTANANNLVGSYSVTASLSGLSASFALSNLVGAVGSIAATSGGAQSTTVNTAFGLPVTVSVSDSFGNPVPGSVVTFTAPSSGASARLSSSSAITDSAGQANVLVTANQVAGGFSVSASTPGAASGTTFPLTNQADVAAAIAVDSGTGQSATVDTAFGAPLRVRVLDAFGNAVASESVTFVAPSSGATVTLSSASAVTDTAGYASVTASAGSLAGSFAVNASIGAGASSSFMLTNTAGAVGSIVTSSGSGQSATVNTAFAPLVLRVLDAHGNPVPGATVSLTVPSSGPSASLGAPSAITDVNGEVSVSASANPLAGSFVVSATAAGAASPAFLNLTNTAGTASGLNVSTGSGQSAAVLTAYGAPLVVSVLDAGGNPVPGVSVTFSAPSSGASAALTSAGSSTDAQGNASVTALANGTAGAYNVTATAAGIATPVLFALTNSSGPPGSIAAVGGSAQSAVVAAAFGAALSVSVLDAQGNPVPGAAISFTVPSSGASAMLSALSATSDALGQASVTASANTLAGSYSVIAVVSGAASPAAFTLTNVADSAASIGVVSGATQSTTVGSAFGSALRVRVLDQHGNPVPGSAVTFAPPGSGASADLSSLLGTSDAAGEVSVSAQANLLAGAYAVTASAQGASAPASFALTNTPASVASIAAVSGGGQSASVATAFTNALFAVVRDVYSNPVSGVTVSFSVPGSGASAQLGAASAVTDVSGLASVTVTADVIAGAYNVSATPPGPIASATFALVNAPAAAAAISATAGATQTTTVGTAFATDLSAAVADVYGNAVPGVTVTFSAPSTASTALLTAPSAVTDASGTASVHASASSSAGSYLVTAAVSGVEPPANFALANLAGTAAFVSASSGGGQSTPVTGGFATALSVLVRDAQSNPVAGATVSFAVPSGASAVLGSATAVTDALGRASVSATANNLAGAYLVIASVAGAGTTATFGLTNLPGSVATISVSAGQAQHASVTHAFATPLTAAVIDAQGNPVPGVAVSFAAPGSGASANISSSLVTTDAAGLASVTVTANRHAGGYAISASAPGAASPASFGLTNDPGAPSSLVASSGGGQSASVTTAFGAALNVTVLDAYGNPVPGATLNFAAPESGASAALSSPSVVSDSSGAAASNATANALAGTYSVIASLTPSGITAIFALTNVAGAVGSIAAISGDGQHAVVAASYGSELRVQVLDGFANPVQGAIVSFSLSAQSAGAQLSGHSAITDASGQSAITATANQVAGAYTLTASSPGAATPALFSLTNDAGAPNAIVASSGAQQSAMVTSAFGNPLIATVLDAYGNPVPAVTVSFSVPASSASAVLDGGTAVSDANGRASISAMANAVAGSYNATASLSGGVAQSTFALTNLVGAVGSIAATSGGAQSATVNTSFGSPLLVTVSDSFGNPVSGTLVTFAGPGAGASAALSGSSALTDGAGHASISAVANAVAGNYAISASAPGVASPALFSLTNQAAAAAALAMDRGTGQSAAVDDAFGAPLRVRVSDAFGNPVAAATVVFSAPGSGASARLSGTSAVSDANGYTSVTASANNLAGSFLVNAALGGGVSVNFALTNVAGGVGSIVANAGSGQTTTVNTAFAAALRVLVLDALGNPVPAAQVTLAVPSSGASALLSASSASTDSDGALSVTVSANNLTGSFVVTATVPGASSPAFFNLTNTAGSAATLTVNAGSGQSAAVETSFTAALAVNVRDANGNPVAGVSVQFDAPSSGASVTLGALSAVSDAQGHASVSAQANVTAGSYDVSASALGIVAPVTFALTNTSGAPGSIAAVSGSGQSATVDTAFGDPLAVSVQDAQGNPVAGATVTFSVFSSGPAAVFDASSSVTDALGHASVTARANELAGTYSVSASVPGAASASMFTLTNRPAGVASLTVLSGAGQSAPVTAAFGSALRVAVRDEHGNPVAGSVVSFATPSSGASADLASLIATSDASGVASVSGSANTHAGSYAVSASAPGAASPASFALTNLPGPAALVAIDAGDNQSTVVATAFATPLSVQVRDAYGNAVPSSTVSFAAVGGSAAALLDAPSPTTDSTGRASVQATANAQAGSYRVDASVAGVATAASFALSNQADRAAAIRLSQGTSQFAEVLSSFAEPLTVSVLDALGNPVAGVVVQFSTPSSGAAAVLSSASAVTDAAGLASVTASANGSAGAYQVGAALPDALGATAFDLENRAGAAFQLTVIGGSAQSAQVGSTFSAPLMAAVFDAQHNPVPGVLVSFSAPASGPSASTTPASATTDSAGQVSVTAIANHLAGHFDVTATSVGLATPAVFSLTSVAGAALTVQLGSGAAQHATVNADFALPLMVVVSDAFGNPVPNAVVHFAGPSAGPSASLRAASASTDSTGQASAALTANNHAGSYSVVASLAGSSSSVTFALSNDAGAPALISIGSGANQSAVVHQSFSSPFDVLVVDAAGNPVANTVVSFSVSAGPASATLSMDHAATDGTGHATIRAAANSSAGSYTITVNVPGLAPVVFTLTNRPGAPTRIVVASADAIRAATVHTSFGALRVTVTDDDANPVSGVPLTFAAPSAEPSASLSTSQVTSDANGSASVDAQAGASAGTYSVVVSGDGYASAFTLSNLAGEPNSLSAESGGNASSVVQSAFAAALNVLAEDADGNPVPGARITFSAPSSGATASFSTSVVETDSSGHAQVSVSAGSVAGEYGVIASLDSAGASVSFTLTNTAGAVARLQPMAATTPQSAQVGTAYQHALGAQLLDAFDNPVAGGTVLFTFPGSGPSAALEHVSLDSDARGQVTTGAMANLAAGSFTVTATLANSALHTSFELTNLAGPANVLTLLAGSPQDATVGEDYGVSLQVVVSDAYGNPVENAQVAFSAPGSGSSAVLSANSAASDVNGKASVIATAGTLAGAFDVAAVSGGSATPVTFHLNNVAGAASSIVVRDGSSPQTAAVGDAFAVPLRVAVSDRFGNAVPAVSVAYSAPSTDPSAALSNASAQTDSLGFAEVSAIASSVSGDYAVTASVDGVDVPASFALTNTSNAPTLLVLSAGDQQHAIAGSDFALPLAFNVSDATGHPSGAVLITLRLPNAPKATVTVPADAIVTDDHGHAEVTLTAANTLGDVAVIASIEGGAAPVIAHLTIDGIPTTLTLSSAQANPSAAAAIDVSATVASASGDPRGNVRFLVDDRVVGRGKVQGGVANASILLTPGAYLVHAVFDPDAPFASSESEPIALTVSTDEGSLTGAGGNCSVAATRGSEPGLMALVCAALVLLLGWRTRRRRSWLRTLAAVLPLCFAVSHAHAQAAGGLALDRFHSAPAGSDWLGLDSLAIEDHLRWSARVIIDYANHPLVIRNADGGQRAVPVSTQLMMHFNGSLTLFRRWRIALSIPVAAYQQGDRNVYNGYAIGAPTTAFGDIALRGDYLVGGAHDSPVAVALGAAGHVPSGSQRNFTSDGTFGIEPHVVLAGRLGHFIYAGQVGFLIRGAAELAGQHYGDEWRFALGAGVNTLRDKLVIGPELLIATPFDGRGQTAAEVSLGAHYAWNEHWHSGLGFGVGLNESLGTPRERALLYVEYSAGPSRSPPPTQP